MLCFETLVCDTAGKTRRKILADFLCIFFLSVMGYSHSRWSDVGACLCMCQGRLDSGSDQTLFIRVWKSLDRLRFSLCHFDRVVLHRLFGATCLWFSVPIWHSQSDKLHYPQPLIVCQPESRLWLIAFQTLGGKQRTKSLHNRRIQLYLTLTKRTMELPCYYGHGFPKQTNKKTWFYVNIVIIPVRGVFSALLSV